MRAFRGGAGGFARPENALKRADELENVGQKQAALQALHDVVTSKRHRTWSKTYESIMFKLIDLCVEMKKRNQAKEALMQYRNMCQTVAINSLEEVIKYYLKKATEKAEEAQGQAAVRDPCMLHDALGFIVFLLACTCQCCVAIRPCTIPWGNAFRPARQSVHAERYCELLPGFLNTSL